MESTANFAVLFCDNFIVIVTATIAILLTYRWFSNRTRRLQLSKIPGPPTRWPLIGNIDLLLKKGIPMSESSLQAFDNLSEEFSEDGIFKLEMGPMGVSVYLFRADTVDVILKSSVNIKKSKIYRVYRSWVGESLAFADGAKWRHDRKFLSALFNFKILENMIPLINQHSRVLVDVLERNRSVKDLMKKMTAYTFDVIGELLFGVNQQLQVNSENRYHEAFSVSFGLFCKRLLNPVLLASDFLYWLTPDGKLQSQLTDEMSSYTEDIVMKRREELMKLKTESGDYGEKPITMVDLLLRTHLEDPESMSIQELRRQLDTFFIAGHETTAVSTAFGLVAIANHQDIQKRIHEELDLVFGEDSDRDVTSEDLGNLKYLDCVVKEVLRLWTPLPVIARELVEDVKINDYIIPKATDVWIYFRGLHADPKQFVEPHEFDPDRFLPENSAGRHSSAYLPFSGGLRNCIGYKLALIEFKVAYANILRRFQLNPITKLQDIVYTFESSLKSKEQLAVEFVERFN